jgi:hypothetical protein
VTEVSPISQKPYATRTWSRNIYSGMILSG